MFNNPIGYIIAGIIGCFIIYSFQHRPRYYEFTDEQEIVIKGLREEGIIAVVRLEDKLFQLIYYDNRAINTWHPDIIKFFSFLDINEAIIIGSEDKWKK